jgi:hypothetical protein
MNQTRFDAIIEAYGADPRRWPEAERADAMAWAQARAETIRAQEALDRALDLYAAPLDLDRFAARALDGFSGDRGANVLTRLPLRRSAGPLWALAACALLGIALGFGAGRTAPTDAAYETIAGAFGAAPDALGEGANG